MNDADRPSRTRFRFFRRFTTHVINRFARHFVYWLPYFALISYRGRKTGKRYTIPMSVFRDGSDYIFALTYGGNVQWVKNVLASGEADLRMRNTTTHLVGPIRFVDPTRHLMPWLVRKVLVVTRVDEFLRMSPASPGDP
jgi:deazaflavin-dependent oxidoreductase (nitroreductase family)